MLLSIITVVFNSVNTIERTVKSIVEQKVDDIEYIIIDGGSTDGTLDIIKEYEKDVDYWVSEPDEGIYYAMNKGINVSSGRWVAFMNADDWYEPNILEKILKILESSTSKIVYGKVNKIEDGKKNGYIGICEETNPEILHAYNLYCHQGLFIKRDLFNYIGLYDCKYNILADYDWILKAHSKGMDPLYINLCVANFTTGGISSRNKAIDESYEIIKKNYVEHEKLIYLNRPLGRYAFDYFYGRNESIYKNIVSPDKYYYIWGLGVYGNKMYEIMKKLGCSIIGFIDSNTKISCFKGQKVFLPKEILQNEEFLKADGMMICIATDKYEEDIIRELEDSRIFSNRYVCLKTFFDIALSIFFTI